MKWDDYRIILAVVRCRKLAPAAKSLGLTLSTIYRRLEKIEEGCSEPLFRRDEGLYEATQLGSELALAAERMEQEVFRAERLVYGGDQSLQGRVTITAPEVLSQFFLARHLPTLAKLYPNLVFEVLSEDRMLNLANREADLALRPNRPSDDTLVGRKLSDLTWAKYGRKSSETDDAEGPVIGYSQLEFAEKILKSKDITSPDRKIQTYSNGLILSASLAANGAGVAVIPMILGEQWPNLTRLSGPLPQGSSELWIVCHKGLRRNARIRVVFDALGQAAQMDQAKLAG